MIRLFQKIALSIVGLGIILIAFAYWGPSVSMLQKVKSEITKIKNGIVYAEKLDRLEKENEQLKNEVVMLKKGVKEEIRAGRLIAETYTLYPFNNKRNIIINKGKGDGVLVGMPVLTKEGSLLGKIKALRRIQSEVDTIFNSEWKSSVAVGVTGARGVLRGGSVPKVEFISESVTLHEGDVIMSISPEFPLYLPVGTAGKIQRDGEGGLQNTELKLPVQYEKVDGVILVTNFP